MLQPYDVKPCTVAGSIMQLNYPLLIVDSHVFRVQFGLDQEYDAKQSRL